MPASLYSQCLIKTDNYRLVCADEVRYADSIASGTRLYISSKNAYVSSPRSIFNLVEGYGQYFFKVTNSANSQKIAVGRKWVTRIDSTGAGKALIYIRDINVTFTTTESYTAVVDSAISCFQRAVSSGLATLSDGDYGDVVVSGGGLVMAVDKPDLGLHNLADGDFSVVGDSTALSLTGTRQITLQTQNIDGWISRYLQTNNSLTLRTNSSGKNSRIFVDTTGANFQFVNGANNASLRVGDSIAVRFNTSGSVGQVLTVTSIDGDGRLVINPKTGGSGTANCEQTLTKNSHGFSKWTPIYWNGSTWARPTYDSIIPSYIVVDSTSANTFKVANCGNYDSDLASGIYYYRGASPGYSTNQTSIPTPLFEVVESRLILQPLVGFQLAGGSTGISSQTLADTAAAIRSSAKSIYAGSDSLSQENTYAAMAADGSQTFALGYFPSFPFYDAGEANYGYYNSPANGEQLLLWGRGNSYNYIGNSNATSTILTSSKTAINQYGRILVAKGKIEFTVGGGDSDKRWTINIDTSKFEITRNISGTDRTYELLPPAEYPSTTAGAISSLLWTAGTSSFLRSQHGVATGTTDGSGDLTVTFAAAMPDATYTLLVTPKGTTYYTTTYHTEATGTVKVRFFDAAGAAVTATSVTISYEAKDY